MRDQGLLLSVRIKGFEPRTFKQKQRTLRKEETRDILKAEIEKFRSLEIVRDNCKDKKLFLFVHFYLWAGSTQTNRIEKDLDNLLKILFDSLSEYIDNTKNIPGLGIITNDKNIFRIHASKEIVDTKSDEGFKIEISELQSYSKKHQEQLDEILKQVQELRAMLNKHQ